MYVLNNCAHKLLLRNKLKKRKEAFIIEVSLIYGFSDPCPGSVGPFNKKCEMHLKNKKLLSKNHLSNAC